MQKIEEVITVKHDGRMRHGVVEGIAKRKFRAFALKSFIGDMTSTFHGQVGESRQVEGEKNVFESDYRFSLVIK